MAEFFLGVVISAIYVSRGTFSAKSIFFKKPRNPFPSETGQNTLSYFYQCFRGTIVKKALFPSWRTLSTKWFSRENFHFCCFVWTLSGKNPAGSSKNGLRWQKNNWGKLFLLRMIWFSILFSHFEQNFQVFGRKISTGVLILQSPRRDDQPPEKHFFSNKLSISNYIIILRTKSLDIQRKRIMTFRAAFNVSAGKSVWKNLCFVLVTILYICSDCDGNTFESSAKNFPLSSPNCFVRVQMND